MTHSPNPPLVQSNCESRALKGSAGTKRRALALGWVALGWALLASCTLTEADYDPALVSREPLQSNDGGVSPPVPSCAGGVECCDAIPCTGGLVCRGGACVLAVPRVDAGEPPCSGSDCASAPPPELVPTCDDGLRNGDEAGIDCGGSCARGCVVASTCSDGVRGGDETDTDCGGSCTGCADGASCAGASDCTSGFCNAQSTCATPSCTDGERNGDEVDVDCGGSCPERCGPLQACVDASDCESGVCAGADCALGAASCCQPPRCDDGVQNGDEPSPDCGNAACGPCGLGSPCGSDAQCASGFCQGGQCSDPGSCNDGIRNGRETGTDCGGGTCGRCPDLSPCTQASDCNNNNCDFRGICISCGDNVINGTETGVDCGGADPFCRRCNLGERCFFNSDCLDGTCFGGFC